MTRGSFGSWDGEEEEEEEKEKKKEQKIKPPFILDPIMEVGKQSSRSTNSS